ncbi:hypothetical protein KI387_026433, partial [Taxus chinensis]
DRHWLSRLTSATEEHDWRRLAEPASTRGDWRWSLSEVDTNIQDVQIEPPAPQISVRKSQR